MQAYSEPERESDPHSLPDIEVFEQGDYDLVDDEGEPLPDGWYWWSCLPGCLPDGEPTGPFDTEEEALEDAQQT